MLLLFLLGDVLQEMPKVPSFQIGIGMNFSVIVLQVVYRVGQKNTRPLYILPNI